MRLLILGGTGFLGRAIVNAALSSGHDMTCAARGVTGEVPPGATLIHLDRDEADYRALAGTFDTVVDVSSRPSFVRAAVDALAGSTAHWIYISSASAYRDNATPGQRAATAPTHEPAGPDEEDPTAHYGPCKVSCERAVIAAMGADRAFICRAGLIVGPEDDSGRFTYWPVRIAAGGEIVAPGDPAEVVQWVDVRDLAGWLVRVAEARTAGIYDGIGTPVPRAHFLAEVAAGVDVTQPAFTWIDQEFLASHEIGPWAGPRSLPLWLPVPEYAGFMARDTSPSLAAGLVCRELAETARDTLAWTRSSAAAGAEQVQRTGLTAEQETDLLTAWHAR